MTCIGGMDARNERRALERGAHIVVGTPGRLRDHIMRGALDLDDIRAIVLDEADEMLDLGFREDLEFMLGAAPDDRRTLLFSATVSKSISQIATNFQRDAKRISTVSERSQHTDISYQVIQCAPRDSENAIINLLRYHDSQTSIVFANTRAAVARLTARFANRGFSVVSLSGELSQDERSHALQALRDGRARVCVATDVAARGIDLPNLELVIHADLPSNTEGLLHRSGRTGRAGRKGISALIAPDNVARKASRLLGWAKVEAEWKPAPSAEDILALDEKRLLDDAAWTAELSDTEQAFAATLLEKYSPEQVAAACLRLYRAGLSAPEDINAHTGGGPAAARKQDPRASFGPSAWISLSVGRDKNAEPRWLLPLMCRAGNLEKSQIGKIKMEDRETFVELKADAIDGFFAALKANGELEDEVYATRVQGTPTFSRDPAPAGKPKFAGKGKPKGGRPYDKPKFDKPRGDKPKYDKFEKPARKERDDEVHAPAKGKKPYKAKGDKPPFQKDGGKPKSKADGKPAGSYAGKPKAKYSKDGAQKKPHRKGAKYGSGKGGPKGGDARPVRKG